MFKGGVTGECGVDQVGTGTIRICPTFPDGLVRQGWGRTHVPDNSEGSRQSEHILDAFKISQHVMQAGLTHFLGPT